MDTRSYWHSLAYGLWRRYFSAVISWKENYDKNLVHHKPWSLSVQETIINLGLLFDSPNLFFFFFFFFLRCWVFGLNFSGILVWVWNSWPSFSVGLVPRENKKKRREESLVITLICTNNWPDIYHSSCSNGLMLYVKVFSFAILKWKASNEVFSSLPTPQKGILLNYMVETIFFLLAKSVR